MENTTGGIRGDKWKFSQELNKVLFLHWQTNPGELKRFVPGELELDLYEGKPWISLVALTTRNLRPYFLPAFSPVSDFHQINIRTYIKSGNRSGIYFLSMEVSSKLVAALAGAVTGLPYRNSDIKREEGLLISENSGFADKLKAEFSIGSEYIHKDPLDQWLTERYFLLQPAEGKSAEYEIFHREWPLKELKIAEFRFDYFRFDKLISGSPQRLHYSEGVKLLIF